MDTSIQLPVFSHHEQLTVADFHDKCSIASSSDVKSNYQDYEDSKERKAKYSYGSVTNILELGGLQNSLLPLALVSQDLLSKSDTDIAKETLVAKSWIHVWHSLKITVASKHGKEKKESKNPPKSILRRPVSYTYLKGPSGLPTIRVLSTQQARMVYAPA